MISEHCEDTIRRETLKGQDYCYLSLHDANGNPSTDRIRLDQKDFEPHPEEPGTDRNTERISLFPDKVWGKVHSCFLYTDAVGGEPIATSWLANSEAASVPGTEIRFAPGSLCLRVFPSKGDKE